jgi:hypothetical protein
MDKKQQAIELLKKETTDLANVYKKDGGFVLSGTYEQEEIGPGDYFIARKPKNPLEGLPWIDAMNKFDGVIQKCASIGEDGRILSENTFMDAWWYDPSWCEKVSPGDVMKTKMGSLFIFKEMKNGRLFDYAFYNPSIHFCNPFAYFVINDISFCAQGLRHATSEEAQELFDALAKEGKRWNAEKMCIEDMPKFYTRPKKDFILSGISKISPIEIDEAVLFVSALSDREKRGIEDNPKDKTIPKSTPATDEEVLRSWGCSDEEIRRMEKIEDKTKELTESLANEGIEALNELNKLLAEFNETLPELKAGIMRDMSYSLGKRDALKQVIKLCKKLLNE